MAMPCLLFLWMSIIWIELNWSTWVTLNQPAEIGEALYSSSTRVIGNSCCLGVAFPCGCFLLFCHPDIISLYLLDEADSVWNATWTWINRRLESFIFAISVNSCVVFFWYLTANYLVSVIILSIYGAIACDLSIWVRVRSTLVNHLHRSCFF